MPLSGYTEPVREESDTYKPIDNTGKALIVKVREHKTSVVTSNSPDGAPGVVVDVVDLEHDGGPKLYRNVLWMGGAVVDGLKACAGRDPVMIKFEQRKSSTGRKYPAPARLDEVTAKKAQTWYGKNEDVFADAAASGDDDEAPF